jgi:hypothetical protein
MTDVASLAAGVGVVRQPHFGGLRGLVVLEGSASPRCSLATEISACCQGAVRLSFYEIKVGISRCFCWCCRTGLNCRPLPYQGSALPLSYGSRFRRKSRPETGRSLPQGGRRRKRTSFRLSRPAARAGIQNHGPGVMDSGLAGKRPRPGMTSYESAVNLARCSFAPSPAFWRAASLSSTFLIRSAAKSCWASAMPRSKTSE